MNLFRRLIVAILVFSCDLSAMPEDLYQSITVESDLAEKNDKTGLTQYKGNVTIRQGSMIIDANEVTVHYKNDKVSRILCVGTPASYQHSNKLRGQMLAQADTIEYIPTNKLINLKTDASLSRNGTLIRGDSINYDLQNETWKAKGDNESKQKRIQLVIPSLKQATTPETSQSNISEIKESNPQ